MPTPLPKVIKPMRRKYGIILTTKSFSSNVIPRASIPQMKKIYTKSAIEPRIIKPSDKLII